MNNFEKIKFDDDKETYGYYKNHKLSNGQTIGIYFFEWILNNNNEYKVLLLIANKKRHIKQFIHNQRDILTNKETGKCGLEGLLWAKTQLLQFENSKCCKDGDIITIFWTNNRRRDIYVHELTKFGYILGYRDSQKCLYKKILK